MTQRATSWCCQRHVNDQISEYQDVSHKLKTKNITGNLSFLAYRRCARTQTRIAFLGAFYHHKFGTCHVLRLFSFLSAWGTVQLFARQQTSFVCQEIVSAARPCFDRKWQHDCQLGRTLFRVDTLDCSMFVLPFPAKWKCNEETDKMARYCRREMTLFIEIPQMCTAILFCLAIFWRLSPELS